MGVFLLQAHFTCRLIFMTQTNTSYASAIIKKLDKSRVEITGSITVETWSKYRQKAIKYINESISIDGFRKGMVPENILIAKVGEMAILEEMAELALSKSYIDILINEKIDAIGKPEIHVTKLAKDNPLEFTATTSVVPEITLPDYKKISTEQIKKQNPDDEKVTEKDIDDTIMSIRTKSEANPPELTDDFVKTLGDFSDVPDFKNKISAMVAEQKRDSVREKVRISIADAIVEASTIELPDVMIESELDRTQSQFSADVERMGVKLDDYLKHAKKTLDEVRLEWRPHAEKKAKLQLILNEISKKENLKPDAKEIEGEVNHIVEHYKDADRERAAVYAETVLTNEKVFAWLEKVN